MQVFDDEVAVLVDHFRGHEVLGVFAEVGDAAVQVVDPALGFPPAAGADGASRLGELPAAQAFLGLVASLGVLPGLAFGVGGVGVLPGVSRAVLNTVVVLRVWLVFRWLPVVDGYEPLAVAEFDAGLVECMCA